MRTPSLRLWVLLATLFGPGLGAADLPRIALGSTGGEKASAASRQLRSALCGTFECVARRKVLTEGKVDFAKMRAQGVSGFLFGAVTAKEGGSRLWLALLTTSERPSRTWNLPLSEGGRVSKPAIDELLGGLRKRLEGAAEGEAPPAAAEGVAAAAPGAPRAAARVAFGALKRDPESQLTRELRSHLCGRLTCVKRSEVLTGGKMDFSKMRAREVSGFLSGAVAGKGRARTLELRLFTSSDSPARVWSLPLSPRGRVATASLESVRAELEELLEARAAAAETLAAPPPRPEEAPAAEVAAAPPPGPAEAASTPAGEAGSAAATPPPPVPAEVAPPAPPPTTPQAPEPPAPPAPAAPPKEEGPRTSGLIPGVLLGPKVTAAALFPPSLTVGAEIKVVGYLGASFEYGLWPQNTSVSNYSINFKSWSAGLRVYPFRGAFFVGAALANYNLNFVQAATAVQSATTLNLKSTTLGPQIGWKWTFDFGLFLGLNLGYGFSLNYASPLVGASGTNLQTVKSDADSYLKPGVPLLTLLELGWLF